MSFTHRSPAGREDSQSSALQQIPPTHEGDIRAFSESGDYSGTSYSVRLNVMVKRSGGPGGILKEVSISLTTHRRSGVILALIAGAFFSAVVLLCSSIAPSACFRVFYQVKAVRALEILLLCDGQSLADVRLSFGVSSSQCE